jgi:hypothetical protein
MGNAFPANTPPIPVTPGQLAHEAALAVSGGVSAIHVHPARPRKSSGRRARGDPSRLPVYAGRVEYRRLHPAGSRAPSAQQRQWKQVRFCTSLSPKATTFLGDSRTRRITTHLLRSFLSGFFLHASFYFGFGRLSSCRPFFLLVRS